MLGASVVEAESCGWKRWNSTDSTLKVTYTLLCDFRECRYAQYSEQSGGFVPWSYE
jgi:hypothetical protein